MSRSLCPLLLSCALLAAPATADVFHVTLTNGNTVDSSVQPQQASWDPNLILLLTDVGNWVGFPKDQIQGIRAEDPTSGFGVRISSTAIALGRFSNDLPEDNKSNPQDALNARYLDLANKMLEASERQQRYSVQQFAEPGQTQGIPSSFGGYGNGGVPGQGFGSIPLEPDAGRFVESQDRTGTPDSGNPPPNQNQQ